MWFTSIPNVTHLCVSTDDQMIHSNLVPPIRHIFVQILTSHYVTDYNGVLKNCTNVHLFELKKVKPK